MVGNLRTFSKLGTQYYGISTSIQRITLDGKPTAIYNAANSPNSVYIAFHDGVGNNNTSFVIPPGKSIDLGINSRPIYLVSAGTSFVYFAPAELKKGREIQEDVVVSYPLREMMVAGYSFNNTPNDITENGYNLTAVNSPTYTTGVHGNCAAFVAASSQRFTYADGELFVPQGDMAICGYFRWPAINSNRVLIAVSSSASPKIGWRIASINGQSYLRWMLSNTGTSDTLTLEVAGPHAVNTWYWFLASLVGTTATLYTSVGGGSEDSDSFTGPIFAPDTLFSVGARSEGTLTPFTGNLEDVVVFNGDITPYVTWLKNSGSGRSAQQIYDYTGE